MFKASCYYRYFRGDYITHLTKGAGFCFYFHEAVELNNFIYYLFTGNFFKASTGTKITTMEAFGGFSLQHFSHQRQVFIFMASG